MSLIHLPYDMLLYLIPPNPYMLHLFKLLRVNRVLRYADIYRYYQEHNDRVNLNTYLAEVMHLTVLMMMLLHTLTCTIIFISTFFEDNMSVHVPTDFTKITTKNKVELYITYFYMIVSSICRVGINSHSPDGPFLITYTIMFLIICPILYTHVYAKDFVVIFKRNFLRKVFYDKLQALQFLFHKQEISGQIEQKTFRYIQLMWYKHSGVLRPHLLGVAPIYLQELVSCASYSYNINNHFMFSKCHVDFRRQLCNFVDFELFFAGDYITFKKSINGRMYIIRKGEIEVLDEDATWTETRVRVLKTFNSFGLRQGIDPNLPQDYSYRALRFSVVLFLRYEKWNHLLQFFPASKEIIYKIANDMDS